MTAQRHRPTRRAAGIAHTWPMTEIRKGQAPEPLTRVQFHERFVVRFYDPAFDKERDAIATQHPGKPMYTFRDYMRNRWPRDAGLRIDHLLLNAAAAKRLKAAGVDREVRGQEKASDHAPAWVLLR